jgi:hypothetical protein
MSPLHTVPAWRIRARAACVPWLRGAWMACDLAPACARGAWMAWLFAICPFFVTAACAFLSCGCL